MNNKLKLIDVIFEAITPPWSRFRLKINAKLASGVYQFEEAFVRDLERMAAEGKIKYNKLSRELTELVADSGGEYKLTDDDFKILMRSYNFRNAVTDTFNELNINTSSAAHIGNLTGNFARIWRLFSQVPESKIVKGAGSKIVVDWGRKIQKGLSDFSRKHFASFQKLLKIYDTSMEEFMALEKELDDEIQNALGNLTTNDGIGKQVKKINALMLRIRDFNKKHPRMFWEKAKIELNTTADGQSLIKAVEESRYFTIFRERFAKLSPESTDVPNNTITRLDGAIKFLTLPKSLNQRTFWKGMYEFLGTIPKWRPQDSRVLSILTTLDARTWRELQFNATIRGNKLSAQSYIYYKIIQIYVILPVCLDIIETLFDGAFKNYKYTEEQLREIFPESEREMQTNALVSLFKHHLKETYGKDFGNLIWEWSPALSYLFSETDTRTGRDTSADRIRQMIETEENEFRGWFGAAKQNSEAFGRWVSSWWPDNFLGNDSASEPTPSPTPTATATAATNTGTIPAPPTDPNQVSEEMSDAEVDDFINTNMTDLKSFIVKPYTVNTDKTVTLFLSGEPEPMSTLIKVGGKITIKNSN